MSPPYAPSPPPPVHHDVYPDRLYPDVVSGLRVPPVLGRPGLEYLPHLHVLYPGSRGHPDLYTSHQTATQQGQLLHYTVFARPSIDYGFRNE